MSAMQLNAIKQLDLSSVSTSSRHPLLNRGRSTRITSDDKDPEAIAPTVGDGLVNDILTNVDKIDRTSLECMKLCLSGNWRQCVKLTSVIIGSTDFSNDSHSYNRVDTKDNAESAKFYEEMARLSLLKSWAHFRLNELSLCQNTINNYFDRIDQVNLRTEEVEKDGDDKKREIDIDAVHFALQLIDALAASRMKTSSTGHSINTKTTNNGNNNSRGSVKFAPSEGSSDKLCLVSS